MPDLSFPQILDSRHPNFLLGMGDWIKWRTCYNGGTEFRDAYLKQFSNRETAEDFKDRREITPIPTFAKAALNDIRNAIFQRLNDVVRTGGSRPYQRAVAGEEMGVDRHGSTMNYFLGNKCLTDLLVMGKVGVYVDAPSISGVPTLANDTQVRPYLYSYRVEDILNFSCTMPENPSLFQSILLRDAATQFDEQTSLPLCVTQRYRLVWIDKNTGRVNIQFYDLDGKMIDREGNLGGPIQLELTRIPFHIMDLGDSLLKDVCDHQIALLNLGSSDVNYCLKSNFPFYTEQRDNRDVGHHLKSQRAADGTATNGGQGSDNSEIAVGPTQGRYYAMEAERPQFIAPPAEPIEVSLKLQAKLEGDIRKLINLSVAALAPKSAESKSKDDEGLEAGLSFIGLQLQGAERRIADFWSAYEERSESRREVATVAYPDKYSLKTDADRISEAATLGDLIGKVPSRTAKREIAKNITSTLLGGKVKVDTLATIHKEIDTNPYTTSDPKTIIDAKDAGLVGEQTASVALGFDDDEYLTAREDHIRRATEIAAVQGVAKGAGDPASRGVPDLSTDPSQAGSKEKEASRNTDLNPSTKKPVRGEGRATKE